MTKESQAMPTAYRPGRLSNLEILERIFPFQKRTVLELVLQGCNGDLVKAIEHFLSAQDTIMAQQHMTGTTTRPQDIPITSVNGFHPYMTAFSPFRNGSSLHSATSNGKMSLSSAGGGGVKSAFTPLSPPANGMYPGLHSAFSPRSAAFTTEALLNRTPAHMPHAPRGPPGSDLLTPPHAHFAYAGLGHMPAGLPGFSAASLFLNPYRPFTIDSMAGDKVLDRTDHSADSYSDHNDSSEDSPNKDKDSD